MDKQEIDVMIEELNKFLGPEINRPRTLSQAMTAAKQDVENHYAVLANNMRTIADHLRGRASFIERMADGIDAKNQHIQQELTMAAEFESDVLIVAKQIRAAAEKMSGNVILSSQTTNAGTIRTRQEAAHSYDS